jgi:hypothetical protein
MLEFPHASTGCSLVIDDDGRVAYAYLRDPERAIIGDVWLYNRAAESADWADPSKLPFPNPPEFARPLDGPLPGPGDLTVRWTADEVLLLADVLLRGELLARLSPGAQPGWNVLAMRDGPLAQKWPGEALV